jgi:hypothetical protein
MAAAELVRDAAVDIVQEVAAMVLIQEAAAMVGGGRGAGCERALGEREGENEE